MDYKQLLKDIKGNDLSNIYLFYGNEYLIANMMLENIKKSLINPLYEQLNVNYLDGKTITVDELINACETLPFMDTKRLIVVKNMSSMNINNNILKTDMEMLCKYLSNIPISTYLIFISRKIDKKRKIYKSIQKNGKIIEYKKLEKNDLLKWINKRVNLRGKKIEKKALDLFVDSSDYLNKDSNINLDDIENELDKLLAYSKEKVKIECCEVQNIVQQNMDTNIFKMLELMGKGLAGESIYLMHVLINNGEPPVRILYMIIRQYRIIYHSKLLRDSGFSTNDIARIMAEKSFVVNKALYQGKNYSYDKLIKAYKYCSQIDRKMKKGQINHKLALEMLIFKFC
ncbi:MAG: DNA polymerase III subunit delta [Eubacteriaceae bacterium]